MLSRLRSIAAAALLALVCPGCDEPAETGDEQNATASTGRFELFVGQDGQHYFQLLAKNGAHLLRSEGYSSLSSAKGGITTVKNNGKQEARFVVLETDSGEFYFNLKAGNGKVIGSSEVYSSKAAAEGGVDAVIAALQSPTSADAETSGARFETFKGQDNKTYFHLRADNGQIVLASQGYSSKSAAEGGITSVKKNGVDATHFDVIEGANDQYTFRLLASNGKVIARAEMYASKSNALRAATTVREIIRKLTNAGQVSDADIQDEIETASEGILYTSESDYPFTFVSADMNGTKPGLTEELVRQKFAAVVDADEDADRPMADLVSMSATWETWKGQQHNCSDPEDVEGAELCAKTRNLEQVLESNLKDIQVFYFGGHGEPGDVQGIGVSIFIVGWSPEGNLVGVRTLAIWT